MQGSLTLARRRLFDLSKIPIKTQSNPEQNPFSYTETSR